MITPAPPIKGTEWLQGGPIRLQQLQDRIVLLVFWSSGCEASLLRIRQLERIKQKHGENITIIGIHSPRLDYESLEVAKQAIQQFHIDFPILHDEDLETWGRYNPSGWPATVIIAPGGEILGNQAGTANISVIEEAVDEAAQDLPTPQENSLQPTASMNEPAPLLAFPSKVACNQDGVLAIADPGNNQILLGSFDENYKKLTIGYKITNIDTPGDITFGEQGAFFYTEKTTGSVFRYRFPSRSSTLLTKNLLSPTALLLDADQSLVVADAGAEQIYRIEDLQAESSPNPIAGFGVTGCRDGAASTAELAQPVSLARSEAGILFCDAGSSTVRLLTDGGKITTISGQPNFDWGLQDGSADKALMQRPSDIFMHQDGSILIADTGNNRLRKLSRRRFRSLGISGLERPEGICMLPTGHIAIADTGNSRIVVSSPDYQSAWEATIEDQTDLL